MKSIYYSASFTVIYIFITLLIFPHISIADTDMSLRPIIGYGNSRSTNPEFDGNIRHFGLRALIHADGSRKFGLELSKFQFENSDDIRDFYSFGIVLEQTLSDWFKMSVGTVGYFRYGPESDSPVGIVTNLGWEPDIDKSFKPFVVLRNDFIFHDQLNIMGSVSLGLTWSF